MVNQPEFKKVLGDVTFCSKMAKFDGKQLFIFRLLVIIICTPEFSHNGQMRIIE